MARDLMSHLMDPKLMDHVRKTYPVELDDPIRAAVTSFVSSIIGDCQHVIYEDGSPWEVVWGGRAAWLSQHGLYICDDIIEVRNYYALIGYCVVNEHPWFTDTSLHRRDGLEPPDPQKPWYTLDKP